LRHKEVKFRMIKNRKTVFIIWSSLCLLEMLSADVFAYIGPGAGFAVVTSFFVLFLTFILSFISLLTWPFRFLLLLFRRRKVRKNRLVKRVVVVGLDGLDPKLATTFMDQGLLPHFSKLRESGVFSALRTTCPSISPVAWSTFATGVNPGKHGIFDFYTRNRKNYQPILSSVQISPSIREVKIGPLKFRCSKTSVKFLRKSLSFWKILGKNGVFCSILRVPISFPPEKLYGTCLSAMCTPDLLGTQGTFSLFSSNSEEMRKDALEGSFHKLERNGTCFTGRIPGPILTIRGKARSLELPFEGTFDSEKQSAILKVGEYNREIKVGKYTPWIRLTFKAGIRKRIHGIARFLLLQLEPHLKLYLTPINIDPEKPSLPVSYPNIFSINLAKLYGPFSTLGLAEDTWALNERVINEEQFLKQTYDIFKERKEILFDSLKKNRDGLVVSVFDTTDRIQHMFFRYLDENHPANHGKDTETHKGVIEQLYRKMDDLIAEVLEELDENDILLIVSDHGFTSFKWGVNLNSWLWKEGYLTLKDGAQPGQSKWLAEVDWNRTRAYAIGLAGIFLNVKGRERDGIVETGTERQALQQELKIKLESLNSGPNGGPIRRALLPQEELHGPYLTDAPDLIIGYHRGYRTSWNSAVGLITEDVLEENTRSWSGDHGIDPELIPGVFFANRKLDGDNFGLEDLAPTILSLFGLGQEKFHDGRAYRIKTDIR